MHWYKCDPQQLLEEITGLKPAEQGAYLSISNIIFSRAGDVPDDDGLVARMIRYNVCEWRPLKAKLISAGKIAIVAGRITSKLSQLWSDEVSSFSGGPREDLGTSRQKTQWFLRAKKQYNYKERRIRT